MTLNTCIKCGLAVFAASLLPHETAFAGGHAETESITEVLRSYESFLNASDAAGLGSLYTTNAVLLPDRFDAFEGAEAITGIYAYAFNALTLGLEFDIDPEAIVVSGNTAYAVTASTGTRLIKEANQTVPEINRELWVFEKVNGTWKIARYAFDKSE